VVVAVKALSVIIALICCASAAAEPDRWTIDYGASRLGFTAEQAQAPFDGTFARFDADVRFDPGALNESRVKVSIDTASIATANKERDDILKGTGWFESDTFAQAEFSAREFLRTADGFEARGELRIRTVTAPTVVHFTMTETDGRLELHGTADLDRFAFGLGLGDWADTKWVGQSVHVVVTLIGSR
jgi:polyisoprenoid-binding protein YceI